MYQLNCTRVNSKAIQLAIGRVSWLSFKTSSQSSEEKDSQVEADSCKFLTATFDLHLENIINNENANYYENTLFMFLWLHLLLSVLDHFIQGLFLVKLITIQLHFD